MADHGEVFSQEIVCWLGQIGKGHWDRHLVSKMVSSDSMRCATRFVGGTDAMIDSSGKLGVWEDRKSTRIIVGSLLETCWSGNTPKVLVPINTCHLLGSERRLTFYATQRSKHGPQLIRTAWTFVQIDLKPDRFQRGSSASRKEPTGQSVSCDSSCLEGKSHVCSVQLEAEGSYRGSKR